MITRESSPSYDNKIVYMSGTLLGDRAIVDHEMAVNCTPDQDLTILSITRSVQVFQWVETITKIKEKIGNNQKRTNTVYKYKAGWGDHVDSSDFDNAKYRVNIEPSIRTEKFQPQRLRLDEMVVNTAYGCHLIEAHGTRLSVRNLIGELPPDNKLGQWNFKNDNTIQRRFVKTADTIGDLRVTFDVRTFAGGEVTIPGLIELGELGPSEFISTSVHIGRVEPGTYIHTKREKTDLKLM